MADKNSVDEEKDPKDSPEEEEEKGTDDADEGGEETTEKKEKKEKAEKSEEGEESDEEEEEEKDEAPKEIPTRKSTLQHILARKNKKIEKLEKKEKEDTQEEEEEDDEEDIGKKVEKAVRQQIEPFVKTLASKADEDELQALIANEPEAKKYENRIRAYMANEHYQGVPPDVIYHHLAFAKSAGITQKKKDIADKEANLNKGAGQTKRKVVRKTGKIPSIEEQENMSDEEIGKIAEDVMQGNY